MTAFAIPGDPDTPTGGYVYDRKLIAASGGALTALRLPGGFPFPSKAELTEARDALLTAGPALIDGLAYGALPVELIDALPCRPVALCHHPLGLEAGLDEATSRRLIETERAALSRAAHVVVTSEATKRTLLADFGLAEGGVTVAPPGLDRAPMAAFHNAEPVEPPTILTVASLTPRKAHDVLADALALIADRDWRAVWAGPDDRADDWAAAIRERVGARGLSDRIDLTGAASAETLDRLYHEASVFCLPSRYEGYGMVFAEAMMRGLPVVACEGEAQREVIGEAGRLVPVDDAKALASTLAAMLDDAAERQTIGAAGHARALAIPGWDTTWAVIRAVLERAE